MSFNWFNSVSNAIDFCVNAAIPANVKITHKRTKDMSKQECLNNQNRLFV